MLRISSVHCPVEWAANFRVGWDESPAEHDRGAREGLRSPLNRREGLRRGDVVASLTGGEGPEAGTVQQLRQRVLSG